MQKRLIIAVIASVVLVTISFLWVTTVRAWRSQLRNAGVTSRPITLVISGPEGQKFTGAYIADGVTNGVTAVAPANLSFQATNVRYSFRREGGTGEFRVALHVSGLPRTSTTSDKRSGVRGALKYVDDHESCWAEAFED